MKLGTHLDSGWMNGVYRNHDSTAYLMLYFCIVFIPRGVLWFHIGLLCPSVHLYFCLRMLTSKFEWILAKLGVCIDIVEIWFWITNGQT